MKVINCPLNGPRNVSEFVYGGELKQMPDPASCSDREWAEYVFYHYNGTGIAREWWLHAPSGYWFIVERHRVTGEISRTYDPSELDQSEFFASVPGAVEETAS